MTKQIPKTAVIAVAGYGTRRLPVTKAIDKCMLPILNRPIIDYVVRDCVRAGITEVILIVSKDHEQIKTYFSQNVEFEEYLATNGKTEKFKIINDLNNLVSIKYVVQPMDKYGTAIPLWVAKDHLDKTKPFILLMGDDFIDRYDEQSSIGGLISDWAASNAEHSLIGVEVPDSDVPKYGVIKMDDNRMLESIVEKPALKDAPSNMINVSKYVFSPSVFKYLDEYMANERTQDEYYITDVSNLLLVAKERILVAESHGHFLDGGNLDGWLAANNYLNNKN